MLPSLRHFFRFVDLDSTFVAHGFYKKVRQKSARPDLLGKTEDLACIDWCSLRIEQQRPSL